MRITKKQQEEIDFLSNHMGEKFIPTNHEIMEYLRATVSGIGSGFGGHDEKNRLKLAKRSLDIMVKMWRQDMREGLLAYWELIDGFDNHPFAVKIVNSIRRLLHPLPEYGGLVDLATIGWLNSKFNLENKKS